MRPQGFAGVATALAEHLSRRRRWQLVGLGALTVMATFAELLSISAAFPFLAVLAAPERLFGMPAVGPLLHFLGITTPAGLIGPFSLLFAVAILIASALRLTLIWAQTRLAHLIGIDLSVEIFKRTLHQPYPVHAARNTSQVITVVNGKSMKLVTSFVQPLLTMLNAATLLGAALVALLVLLPGIGLTLIGGIAVIYGATAFALREPVRRNGDIISREMPRALQALQEGLGGIRDVLLDGSQNMHVNRYARSTRRQRLATATVTILGAAPRFIVEALGMILIVIIAYRLAAGPAGLDSALPLLGGLALGAQRLLPVAQQAYNGWVQIRGAQPAIADCLAYLEQPYDRERASRRPDPLPFIREIRLEGVGLRYAAAERPTLQGIDLHVPRGTRLGIIGPTGSGKSTLADILMGLIIPDKGGIYIDGLPLNVDSLAAWQRHIAHVPQAIFLIDATLAENVAFGQDRGHIDMARLERAVASAQLSETVAAMPKGLETRVGERGVRLSGGQRQRIAIARALYREADVIVFDEATSALDSATEARVMDAIESLNPELTLIMIAHRLSTLKGCDQIVEIKAGRIIRQGAPAEMLAAGVS
jgi:ATP-binding cassette, subfamily B, bacterial PglK